MKNIQVEHAPSELAKALLLYPLSAGHEVCGPAYSMNRKDRSLFGFQLIVVLGGTGHLELNQRTWKLEPGQVIFLDIAKSHCYYADQELPWEILWLIFDGAQASAFFDFLGGSQTPVHSVSAERFDKCSGFIQETIRLLTYRPPSLEIRSSSLINQILTEMMLEKMEGDSEGDAERGGSAISDDIYHALRFMEERYQEPLHLDEIAESVSMSTFHFSRLFKKNTGFTVMEYLVKFRLTQAKKLLKETQLPISEIAVKAGFPDQSYFSKIFKRYELMTPKKYRESTSAL